MTHRRNARSYRDSREKGGDHPGEPFSRPPCGDRRLCVGDTDAIRVRRQGLESESEIGRRLKSRCRILLEAALDDAHQRRGNISFGGRQIWRILLQDRADRVGARLPAERTPSREHLVQDGAQRKDVGAMINRQPARLLWRQVSDRAEEHTRFGVWKPIARHDDALNDASRSVSLASPKSRILTWLSGVTQMFSGLRSRWTIPAA